MFTNGVFIAFELDLAGSVNTMSGIIPPNNTRKTATAISAFGCMALFLNFFCVFLFEP